jgi:hypothetical protein
MCTCTTALCACWCAEQPEELLASVADALGEKYVESWTSEPTAQPGRAPVNPVLAVVEWLG